MTESNSSHFRPGSSLAQRKGARRPSTEADGAQVALDSVVREASATGSWARPKPRSERHALKPHDDADNPLHLDRASRSTNSRLNAKYMAVQPGGNLIPSWHDLQEGAVPSDPAAGKLQLVATVPVGAPMPCTSTRGASTAAALSVLLREALASVAEHQQRIVLAVSAGDGTSAWDHYDHAIEDPNNWVYAAAVTLQKRSMPLTADGINQLANSISDNLASPGGSILRLHRDTRGALVGAVAYDVVDHGRQELHRSFLDALAATGNFQFGDIEAVSEAAYAAIHEGYRWSLCLDPREWGFILNLNSLAQEGLVPGNLLRVTAATHGWIIGHISEEVPLRLLDVYGAMCAHHGEHHCPPGHAAQAEFLRLVISALVNRNPCDDTPIVFGGGEVVLFRSEAAVRSAEVLLSALGAECGVNDPGNRCSIQERSEWFHRLQRSMPGGNGDRRRLTVRPLEEGIDLVNFHVRLDEVGVVIEPSRRAFQELPKSLAATFRRQGPRGVTRYLKEWRCRSFHIWSGGRQFIELVSRGAAALPRELGGSALTRAFRHEVEAARQAIGSCAYRPGARAAAHLQSLRQTGRLCAPRLKLTKFRMTDVDA